MDPVVVVYGTTTSSSRPRRIGTGTLPLRRLVIADGPLATLLAGTQPPRVLRVGIGSTVDGGVRVEVVEVFQVMLSEPGVGAGPPIWGLELAEPAETPGTFETLSRPANPTRPVRTLDLAGLADRLRPRSPVPVPPQPNLRRPDPPPPVTVPAGLWCFLFPRATFCR